MTRKPIDPLKGFNFKAFNKRFREVLTERGAGAEVHNASIQAQHNAKRAAAKKARKTEALTTKLRKR